MATVTGTQHNHHILPLERQATMSRVITEDVIYAAMWLSVFFAIVWALVTVFWLNLRHEARKQAETTRVRVIEETNAHERRMAELNNEAIRLDSGQSKATK